MVRSPPRDRQRLNAQRPKTSIAFDVCQLEDRSVAVHLVHEPISD